MTSGLGIPYITVLDFSLSRTADRNKKVFKLPGITGLNIIFTRR